MIMYILIIFHYFFIVCNDKLFRGPSDISIASDLSVRDLRSGIAPGSDGPDVLLWGMGAMDRAIGLKGFGGADSTGKQAISPSVRGGSGPLRQGPCGVLWAGQSDLKASNSPDLLISFHMSLRGRSRTSPKTESMYGQGLTPPSTPM